MDLSIVISLFNEEESLPELVSWIDRTLKPESVSYEIIMVDDGSTDGTAELIKKWQTEDNGFEIQSCEFVRIPNDTKQLTDEQRESVQKLIDKIEEDEDVQNVFTNIAE